MIKLFVGLGNPGASYEHTRHNAGFWWIDELARLRGWPLNHDKNHHGLVARQTISGQAIWLLEPLTFMNLSGKSVGSLAKFFKVPIDQVLVAHDELDLPAGEAKLKQGGSHAGHNGLKDIAAALGGQDFWRLRIGIGHPGVKTEVPNWVLQAPRPDDRLAIHSAIDRSLKAFESMIVGDMVKAIQTIHTTKLPRPKPPRPLPTPDEMDQSETIIGCIR